MKNEVNLFILMVLLYSYLDFCGTYFFPDVYAQTDI